MHETELKGDDGAVGPETQHQGVIVHPMRCDARFVGAPGPGEPARRENLGEEVPAPFHQDGGFG